MKARFQNRTVSWVVRFFQEDKALSLVLINVVLATVWILLANPFGFFLKNYQSADPFFPFAKNEIERIQIGRKGHETVLERTGGAWIVTVRNNSADSDSQKVAAFLNGILKIRKFTKIEENGSNGAEFGFNGEELKLELQTASGEIASLGIGAGETNANGTFVQERAGGPIWLVEENLNSLSGRGNETFFFSGKFFPETGNIQEIHTILIHSDGARKIEINIEQIRSGVWKPNRTDTPLCPGDDCSPLIQKILSWKAERIWIKPFHERILPLSSGDKLQIEIHFHGGQNSPLRLEWIGNTIDQEPIFRSNSDSVLFVADPVFLRGFREDFNANEFFRDSSDPF
ncbi:DUF4340 domain-containing protein [Leptospira sanjuanensis]|uniref:DUF4340 domain-containing protein n=1 Tax=Leptospira sanjuanensis TaxID=2879643 RepID=UPI001EE9A175|nr:DUF4340 domain-containing protein [Leptospira sanjuanensis]MCG6168183.1 DUF4340 domain-containing protein [Leptospira sanjuanensis]